MAEQAVAVARAHALLQANRPEDALRELATLPPSEAVGIPAARIRCAALLDLSRWQETVQAARAALGEGQPDPDLLCLLGRAEQQLGHLDRAEQALLEGLALAPSDVSLLCAYAQLCIAAGQLKKATMLTERATAESPGAPMVYATRVHLAYARGDDRTAQRISREFVANYPESSTANALQGGASAARGQLGPAYAGLAKAASSEPTSSEYAEAALDARVARHPLLLPLRPFVRFGPVKTWLVAIALIFGLRAIGLAPLATLFAFAWVLLCVYSWVAPSLVGRWVRRRWR